MYAHGIPRAALEDNGARTFSSQSGLERTAHGFFSFKSASSRRSFHPRTYENSWNVFFRIVSRGIPRQPFREIRTYATCVRAPRATVVRYSKRAGWYGNSERYYYEWPRNLKWWNSKKFVCDDFDDSLIFYFRNLGERVYRGKERKFCFRDI